MRVLIVEDDEMIGEAVRASLRDAASAADWVADPHSALTAAAAQRYDMVLLDLGLPGRSGIEVLRELRRLNPTLPVLIITARDALADRVAGLDAGADDYLLKPFEMVELMARMRAVDRRRGGQGEPILHSELLSLEPSSREACRVGAEPVRLSAREYALLHALMVRPGAILSRAELEERIYGWGDEVKSNAVEFLIHALRRKLGSDAIRNVRGVGWMVSRRA